MDSSFERSLGQPRWRNYAAPWRGGESPAEGYDRLDRRAHGRVLQQRSIALSNFRVLRGSKHPVGASTQRGHTSPCRRVIRQCGGMHEYRPQVEAQEVSEYLLLACSLETTAVLLL